MLPAFIEPWLETRLLPTLTRAYPCRFTFYDADPVSSIQGPYATRLPLQRQRIYLCFTLIRSDHETLNRLSGDESIHNLRDVRDRDAPIEKVIWFD